MRWKILVLICLVVALLAVWVVVGSSSYDRALEAAIAHCNQTARASELRDIPRGDVSCQIVTNDIFLTFRIGDESALRMDCMLDGFTGVPRANSDSCLLYSLDR